MAFHVTVVIALIVLGIIFMMIEIFLLPGISVAGVAALIFVVGGIVYAYMFLGNSAGHITVVVSAVAIGATFIYLVKSKAIKRISLDTNIDDKVDNSNLRKVSAGDTGVALSRLNPIGKVLINDVEVEGKSYSGEFIEEDSEIVVVKVKTYNVLVKRK